MKAVITTILLLLFLTKCKESKTKTASNKVPSDTTTQTSAFNVATKRTEQIDTSLLHVDTAKFLGETYTAIYKSNDTLYVVNTKADTILKVANLHPNFEFDDFNDD